jgi:hypothetical protein
MRRAAIVVPVLCTLALATGLADPAPRALAAATNASILLPADQTPDDGNDRSLFLVVPALGIAVRAQGALLVSPVPQTTWLDGLVSFPHRVRPPPRERAVLCAPLRSATVHFL